MVDGEAHAVSDTLTLFSVVAHESGQRELPSREREASQRSRTTLKAMRLTEHHKPSCQHDR